MRNVSHATPDYPVNHARATETRKDDLPPGGAPTGPHDSRGTSTTENHTFHDSSGFADRAVNQARPTTSRQDRRTCRDNGHSQAARGSHSLRVSHPRPHWGQDQDHNSAPGEEQT